MIKVHLQHNFLFLFAQYLHAEICFGVQKADKSIINGMAGSVDRDTEHI